MAKQLTFETYAIMILYDGSWRPYKIYKRVDNKTLKLAKKKIKALRRKFEERFKIQAITMEVGIDGSQEGQEKETI